MTPFFLYVYKLDNILLRSLWLEQGFRGRLSRKRRYVLPQEEVENVL